MKIKSNLRNLCFNNYVRKAKIEIGEEKLNDTIPFFFLQIAMFL